MEPIHVRIHPGERGPVVVLHGGPGAPGSAVGLATALAPEHEVWEPFQRRSGEVELTVDRHVADLREVAPDAVTIVGHSWGAMLALSYAASHPAAVRSLVLVGCGTCDERSRAEYERRFETRLDDRMRARRDELCHAMECARDDGERDRVLALRGELVAEVQGVDLLPEPEPAPTPDADGHERTWRDVLRRQASGLEPQSFAAIDAPVLMVHGDADPHPGDMIRETLLPHVPQLEYVELGRCGHEPWRERHAREPLLEVLRAWLAGT